MPLSILGQYWRKRDSNPQATRTQHFKCCTFAKFRHSAANGQREIRTLNTFLHPRLAVACLAPLRIQSVLQNWAVKESNLQGIHLSFYFSPTSLQPADRNTALKRIEWDLNPRNCLHSSQVFETCAINHSATYPSITYFISVIHPFIRKSETIIMSAKKEYFIFSLQRSGIHTLMNWISRH